MVTVELKGTPADIGLQYSNPIQINKTTCKECGTCCDICPRHVPEVEEIGANKCAVVNSERDSHSLETMSNIVGAVEMGDS